MTQRVPQFIPKALKKQAGLRQLPGDKSISHRAIILASLSENTVTFHHFLMSEDCLNTIQVFRQLGVPIDYSTVDGTVRVKGVGLRGLCEPKKSLDVGNSGTSIRLITGILSGQWFNSKITGDASIQKRPMKRIIKPLTDMGAHIVGTCVSENIVPPLLVTGTALNGISYTLPIASAQVKSCLLLAGLFAKGITTIIEPKPTRNHTEIMLKGFGVDIKEVYLEKTGMHITLTPPQHLIYKNNDSKTLKIPSDFSSAAYFIVLALITGMDLTIHDISINPTRSALLTVFEAFGIPQRKVDDIRAVFQGITIRYAGKTMGEPFGDIRINTLGLDLQNGTVSKDLIPLVIDEIPILSIYGLFASGELRVDHAAELRVKESDRIKTIVQMITALGGVINETDEGFQLRGNPEHVSPSLVRIDPHFDHRIAMSSIIASLATQTEIQVKDIDCINTSFPHFMKVVDGLIS